MNNYMWLRASEARTHLKDFKYMITHKNITVDPLINFGRPFITGTGIGTESIFRRFKAGESVVELAADYFLRPSQIEDAIRFELHESR